MSHKVYDISEPIRDHLASVASVTDIVSDKRFPPVFFGNTEGTEWDEEADPKLMFQEAGGNNDYRYLFIAQGSTPQEAKQLAVAVQNALTTKAYALQVDGITVVTCALPEGGMTASRNEITKAPQQVFYLLFTSF